MCELLCGVCVQGVAVGGAAIEAHLVAQRRVDAPPQHLAQRLIARLAWVEQKLHRLVAPIVWATSRTSTSAHAPGYPDPDPNPNPNTNPNTNTKLTLPSVAPAALVARVSDAGSEHARLALERELRAPVAAHGKRGDASPLVVLGG